jgi:hypothetical protein
MTTKALFTGIACVFGIAGAIGVAHSTLTSGSVPVQASELFNQTARTPLRVRVDPAQAPYNAIGHIMLEGENAATLAFGPGSSRVAFTVAHNFNMLAYFDKTLRFSYKDDRGNKANIVAVYLPTDYDAQGITHGMYADKAIVVLDRPVENAGHFELHSVDPESFTPTAVRQAGYPAVMRQAGTYSDIPHLWGGQGTLTGIQKQDEPTLLTRIVMKVGGQEPGPFLLKHNINIIPGDSGSPAWTEEGAIGVAQSGLYITPFTPAFIKAYKDIVARTEARPPAPMSQPQPISILRADM